MSVNSDYCKMSPLPDEVQKLQQLNDKLLLSTNERSGWMSDITPCSNSYSPWTAGFTPKSHSNQTVRQRLNSAGMEQDSRHSDEEDRNVSLGSISTGTTSSCMNSSFTCTANTSSATVTNTTICPNTITTATTGLESSNTNCCVGTINTTFSSVTTVLPPTDTNITSYSNPLDYSIHSQLCDTRYSPNSQSPERLFGRTLPGNMSGISSPKSTTPSPAFNTPDQKSSRLNRSTQESGYLKRKLGASTNTSSQSVGKRANLTTGGSSGRHSKLNTPNSPTMTAMTTHDPSNPFANSEFDLIRSPVGSPTHLQPPHLKPQSETIPNVNHSNPGRRRQKTEKDAMDSGSLSLTKSPSGMHKTSNSKRNTNAQMSNVNGDFNSSTSASATINSTNISNTTSSNSVTTTTNSDSMNSTSGSSKSNVPTAAYKYLTWREKDRRRRFREEWKHLWLVIPHGRYEVMCLVCHKVMTQRKLDTIKRHTVRRHVELLGMPESERQDLFDQLMKQHNMISSSSPGSPPAVSAKFTRKSTTDTIKGGQSKYSRIPQRTASNMAIDTFPSRYPFSSPNWFTENMDGTMPNSLNPNRMVNPLNPFPPGKLGQSGGQDQFSTPNHHGTSKITDRTSHFNSPFNSTFPTNASLDRRTDPNALEDLQYRLPPSSVLTNYPENSILNSRSSCTNSKNHTPVTPMVSNPSSPILPFPYPTGNLIPGSMEAQNFRHLFKQFASSAVKYPGSNNFPLTDINMKNPMDFLPKMLSSNRFGQNLDSKSTDFKTGISTPGHVSCNPDGIKYAPGAPSMGPKAEMLHCSNKNNHSSGLQPEISPLLANLSSAFGGPNQNWISKLAELQNLKTPLNTESFPLMMASWAAAIAASSKYPTNNNPITTTIAQIPKDDLMNQSPTASLSSTQSACSWNSERSPLRSLPSAAHHPEQTLMTSNPCETAIKQNNIPPSSPPLKTKFPTSCDDLESYRNTTSLNGLISPFQTTIKPEANKSIYDENKYSFPNLWNMNKNLIYNPNTNTNSNINNELNSVTSSRSRPPDSKQQSTKLPDCCNPLGHSLLNPTNKSWNPENLSENLSCLLCNWENRKDPNPMNPIPCHPANHNLIFNSQTQLGISQSKSNRDKLNFANESDLKVKVTQSDQVLPSPNDPGKMTTVSEAYRLYTDVLASIYNQRKQPPWNNGPIQSPDQLNFESYMTLYYAEALRHQYESLNGSTNLNLTNPTSFNLPTSLATAHSVLESSQPSPVDRDHQRGSRSSTPKKGHHKTCRTNMEHETKINCLVPGQSTTESDHEKMSESGIYQSRSPTESVTQSQQNTNSDHPVSEWSSPMQSETTSGIQHSHTQPPSLTHSSSETTPNLPNRLSPLWWASVSTPPCAQSVDSGNETSSSNHASGGSLRVHVLRLGPGQDLYQSLSHYVLKQRFSGAFVITCCGSVRGVHLRTSNLQKKYFEGPLEVVSLVGTISNEGDPHLHIALADSDGIVIGGHLLDQTLVHTTIELVIGVTGIEPEPNDSSGDVDICDTSSPVTSNNETCMKKANPASGGLRLVRKFSNSTGFRELMVEDMINR